MKYYIKKPIPVAAVQWTGNNFKEILEFMEGCGHCPIVKMNNDLIISTLEGEMSCPIDSYVLRGPAGEFYPCRRDIFEETYEEVKNERT